MESRAKVFGHPIHQMLIVLPVGLFLMAVFSDLVYLITGNSIFATVSFVNIAGGVIGGLIAAIFGLVDYLAIPSGTRAKSVGATHGIGNVVVVVLFALSWFIRNGEEANIPSTLALILSFAGILVASVTAWLGGELVDRLGVGVDPGANLNAPSSLSGQPAYAEPDQAGRESLSISAVPVTGEMNTPSDRPRSSHEVIHDADLRGDDPLNPNEGEREIDEP